MVANKSLAEYNLTQVRFLISRKKNSSKNCENSTPFIHFNHSRHLIYECDFEDDVILFVKYNFFLNFTEFFSGTNFEEKERTVDYKT